MFKVDIPTDSSRNSESIAREVTSTLPSLQKMASGKGLSFTRADGSLKPESFARAFLEG